MTEPGGLTALRASPCPPELSALLLGGDDDGDLVVPFGVAGLLPFDAKMRSLAAWYSASLSLRDFCDCVLDVLDVRCGPSAFGRLRMRMGRCSASGGGTTAPVGVVLEAAIMTFGGGAFEFLVDWEFATEDCRGSQSSPGDGGGLQHD
jgi:hypothetical protein